MYQMTEPCPKILKHGLQSLFLSKPQRDVWESELCWKVGGYEGTPQHKDGRGNPSLGSCSEDDRSSERTGDSESWDWRRKQGRHCAHVGAAIHWTWKPIYSIKPFHLPLAMSNRPRLLLSKSHYLAQAGTHLSTQTCIPLQSGPDLSFFSSQRSLV